MIKHVIAGLLVAAVTACSPNGGNGADVNPFGQGGGGGLPAGGAPAGGAPVTPGNTPFPCNVGAVLQAKCWSCHGSPTNYGAPMSMLNDEAVHAMTKDGVEQVYQRMSERIHSTSSPMPMKGFPALTTDELGTLDSWIAQGAPGGTGCTAAPGGAGGTSSAGGSMIGGGGGGSVPSYGGTTGAGGVPLPMPPSALPEGGLVPTVDDTPVPPDPSECDMVPFHARQDATNAKYIVPAGQQYYCFGFHQDWGPGTQGLAFYPDIDNKQVIHHWLLYKAISPQTNGSVNACLGFHPDGELIAGWAPGATASYLPKHVGIDLGGGDYILEVHYNNTTGVATTDSSGVTVCKAKTTRPDTATVSWLGTEAIILPPMQNNLDVVSNCHPANQDKPIHIIKVWPHMHKLGTHMKADIHRADGTTVDPLFNVDFDFNSQWGYDTPAILNPGDYVTTTCTYDNNTPNTVTFGETTESEMCYNFTYSYPAHSLISAGIHTTECEL
ncbi:MAG TPA: hypothetical protein VH062_19800 [Polyangiaceae bacterium]|jgi:hypothetical protein|nr:hypothetical protein [Polyangiaceae bacterium]